MNKRGLGHLEVVLAFVLFIGFLIFALFFFNPLNSNRLVDSSLYYALDEVSDNITSEMISYSLVLDNSVLSSKIRVPLENNEGYNVRVSDEEDSIVNSYYDGASLVVDKSSSDRRFFKVEFSEEFASNGPITGSIDDLDSNEYSISSSESKKIWSQRKALTLKNHYENDYLGLKKEINLPNRVNFNFRIDVLDGESLTAEREIPEGLEVWSDMERREMITTQGHIAFADLTVNIW